MFVGRNRFDVVVEVVYCAVFAIREVMNRGKILGERCQWVTFAGLKEESARLVAFTGSERRDVMLLRTSPDALSSAKETCSVIHNHTNVFHSSITARRTMFSRGGKQPSVH